MPDGICANCEFWNGTMPELEAKLDETADGSSHADRQVAELGKRIAELETSLYAPVVKAEEETR